MAAAWPRWAIGLGGLLMAGLWIVFSSSHGPTSFNEDRDILGRGMHFWGLLLGVIPNVLIASGLIGLGSVLAASGSRLRTSAYWIVVAVLLGSAAVDLALGALGAPLPMPVLGTGLLLLAIGLRRASPTAEAQWRIVAGLGALLLVAFAWALLSREWSDSIGGYRIFGVLGYLVPGLLWAALGATFARAR